MSVFQNLKKAKGLGSGHNGTGHFIMQRTGAVILIPLVLYFFVAVVRLAAAPDYQTVRLWFASPLNMGLSCAFVLLGFFQSALGLQVVIEDYVHKEGAKYLAIIAVKAVAFVGALVGCAAILKLGL